MPTCRLPTEGAALGDDGVVDVGIAAHITAAASGGPRYDASLSPEERRHERNGIWCCAIHGRQIDADEEHFTVELLRQWKREGEVASARAILALERTVQPISADALDAKDLATLRQLGLSAEETIAVVTARVRAAAQADVAAFKRALKTPAFAVALNLSLLNSNDDRPFGPMGLAAAITAFNHVTVVAPPGTGKTTTLVQAAEAILEGDSVAVFVPLGEWSAQTTPLFPSILERAAFGGTRLEHLKLLAIHGRLVLVLDGWNELDASGRKRLRAELSGLVRDFPELSTLISTRRQALDAPVSGPAVQIATLSEEQQLAIVRALRGGEGEAILDHAWRTPGVRELVGVPLYLTTVLAHTPGDRLPRTKEEVLRLFVREHERAPERAATLHAVTLGLHGELLTALAVEATRTGAVALTDQGARSAIRAEEDRLLAARQLAAIQEPQVMLDALISHHVLVRSPSPAGGISFQHQQFQEFYAGANSRVLRAVAVAG